MSGRDHEGEIVYELCESIFASKVVSYIPFTTATSIRISRIRVDLHTQNSAEFFFSSSRSTIDTRSSVKRHFPSVQVLVGPCGEGSLHTDEIDDDHLLWCIHLPLDLFVVVRVPPSQSKLMRDCYAISKFLVKQVIVDELAGSYVYS